MTLRVPPNGWREVRTIDVLSGIITGKKDVNQALEHGEYPFFSCARETSLSSNEYILNTDAILISGNGSFTGFVKKHSGAFDLYQRTYALHNFAPDIEWQFIYYVFKHFFERKFMGGTSGAAIPYITKPDIERFSFFVPEDRRHQKRIASILSAYDDLIENNRRRIQLLEQAAQLLYKEWFVHLRFPGHEHVKIVNGIPEGWGKKKIADVCETIGGGTPSTKVAEYWDGDITWVVPSDITRNDGLVLLNSERKITEKGLRESSARMIPPETILMTSRASVGFFALMDYAVCTNQGFINIIPHDESMRMYLLFNLMSRVEEIRSNAKGTTYPEISKSRFRDMDIVVPADAIVYEFSGFASKIIHQLRTLKRLVLKLTKARDLLLPRLMNGEIAV